MGGALRGLEAPRQIEHPPLVSVFTGFHRADVSHPLDGFGLLMSEVERGLVLGTLFGGALEAPALHGANIVRAFESRGIVAPLQIQAAAERLEVGKAVLRHTLEDHD